MFTTLTLTSVVVAQTNTYTYAHILGFIIPVLVDYIASRIGPTMVFDTRADVKTENSQFSRDYRRALVFFLLMVVAIVVYMIAVEVVIAYLL
jgi:hypothetical protein